MTLLFRGMNKYEYTKNLENCWGIGFISNSMRRKLDCISVVLVSCFSTYLTSPATKQSLDTFPGQLICTSLGTAAHHMTLIPMPIQLIVTGQRCPNVDYN